MMLNKMQLGIANDAVLPYVSSSLNEHWNAPGLGKGRKTWEIKGFFRTKRIKNAQGFILVVTVLNAGCYGQLLTD